MLFGLSYEAIGVIVSIIVAIGSAICTIAVVSYKLGKGSQRLNNVESVVNDEIKPELKELGSTIQKSADRITKRLDDLLKDIALNKVSISNSPRVLNEYGKKILKESNIGQFVDEKFDEIVRQVKKQNPENAYQVERKVLDIVQGYKEDEETRNMLEKSAFETGNTVDTVLLVGGIYIRDKVLESLKMKVEDIDTHDPKSKEEQSK